MGILAIRWCHRGVPVLALAITGVAFLASAKASSQLLDQVPTLVVFTPVAAEVDPLDGSHWLVDQYLPRVIHAADDGSPIQSFPTAAFGGGRPAGVALEPGEEGKLWISDPDSQRLLRITRQGVPAGALSVAALGISNPADLAFDPRDGTLYVADPTARTIFNLLPIDTDSDGLPDQAAAVDLFGTLPLGSDNPMGVALDPVGGRLFVSDPGLDRIFELETSGALVASFDTGSIGGGSVAGLSWDGDTQSLLAADAGRKLLRISTGGALLAERSTAPFGSLSPQGIVWDPANATLVSVSGERKMIRFRPDAAGGIALWRQESTTPFGSIAPVGIALVPGSVDRYVVDGIQDRVLRVNPQGNPVTAFDTGPAGSTSPTGIATGPGGVDLYVTDNGTRRVYQITSDGVGLGSFSTSPFKHKPQGEPLCNDPRGIAYDATRDHFFVADFQAARVFEVTRTGTFVASFTTIPAAPYPTDVAVDPAADRVTVSDSSGNYAEFTRDGSFVRKYAGVPLSVRLSGATGISVDPDSLVRVLSDPTQVAVYFLSTSGAALGQISLEPYGLRAPTGAAWLAAESRLFAVDRDLQRLYSISPGPDRVFGSGDDLQAWISTAAYGSGAPEGVVLNRTSGTVGWADEVMARLFWLTTSLGYLGHIDLAPAGATSPRGIDQDPTSGYLYASDPAAGLVIAEASGNALQSLPWGSLGVSEAWGVAVSPAEAIALSVERAPPALVSIDLATHFRPEIPSLEVIDSLDLEWETNPVFSSYQVFRGLLSSLATGSLGGCFWSGPTPPIQDAETPAAGGGWFYLVAGKNAAGVASLGLAGDGTPRSLGAISPECP